MSNISALQAAHTMQCWASQGDYAPVAVRKAEGCWIHTEDGRKIFDLRSAHECINLGFNHPKVIAAMKAQMEEVLYVTDDFATPPTAHLAQKLATLTPGSPNKKVYFCQSGAAAVEAAIKAARLYQYNRVFKEGGPVDAPSQYPYPYKIISRYGSWHGSLSGASSASGDPRRWFQEPLTVPGVVFAPDANPYRPHFESVEAHLAYLDHLIEQEGGRNKVAAFLLEAIVGSNGIIVPPDGYLEGVRDLCDRWELLLIADETMTGMGRTGKWLAIEHWEVLPDIIIMGKALGAYCPLAATILSEKVAKSFDNHLFGHGQSYSGHALACAGALAAVDVLTGDGLLDHANEMAAYLEPRLRELGDRYACVGDVRGMGLFWTMELVKDRKTKASLRRATEKYEPTIVKQVSDYLFRERDLYVPSDKFGLWVVPPLIVTKHEIDFVLEALEAGLILAEQLLA